MLCSVLDVRLSVGSLEGQLVAVEYGTDEFGEVTSVIFLLKLG